MPPKPTSPEGESSEIPKTETVFISSNSKTATRLCGVCSSIPAWFWTQKLEVGQEVSVELQPFKEMRAEAQNGCGLCQILCSRTRDYYVIEKGWQQGKVTMDSLLELRTGKLVKFKSSAYELIESPEFSISCRFEAAETDPVNLYPVPASWCLRSLPAADENSDLLLMQDWIGNCRLNHTRCNNVIKDILPTRLLDLEAFNNGRSHSLKHDIKLVRSASFQFHNPGSAPHYITLSHCWGPPEKRPITTTHASLAVRMERILFADLPRTFKDAVVLTRKLGQRYLWIDSLCIIQDDEDDWANEASKMAEVYEQSYCTLAALSSTDSTDGLRMPGKGRTDERLIIDLGTNDGYHGPLNVRLHEIDPEEWQRGYNGVDQPDRKEASPLRYRAWALQEKELSTRSIHFGFRQLLWECRELKGTSQVPWYQVGKYFEHKDIHPEGSALSHRMMLRWLDLCEEYSSRSLTKETDKLPALSGIARSFQKYFPNDKYIAGIWSSHLPLALLWLPVAVNKERHTTEYIAPSWSWTSYPAGIWYENHDLFRKNASKTSGPADKWLDELEVVNIKGQPKHGDDYGALKEGAALELRGALLFELGLVSFRRAFWPDVPDSCQGKLVCLGILHSNSYTVTGLILREHIRDGSPVYSRVAYVDDLDPSLWDGSERRQITLI